MSDLSADKSYHELLLELKTKIRTAQVRAMVTVNRQLVLLYWEIGQSILARQRQANWGDKILKQLAVDLKTEFPNMEGFSMTNLKYMRQFARSYTQFPIGQAPLDQLSWYHNITLLQKCPEESQRFWYAAAALEYGWSRDVLVHQIETRLFERQGSAPSNFKTTLPKPDSDLAQQTLKDPYIFDFLTLSAEAKEKDLEAQLVKHITRFLLELGAGFAFVGSQFPLPIDGEEYRIDLLFYHLKLRRYVAIDLKMRNFKPDDAGKMNFYLSALDDLVKSETDDPSIGIILCKDKKNVVVEYALKDLSKPIGVSAYMLTAALPEDLKSSLPSVEDFEQKLRDVEGQ
jgi:predicted nuclease of restriction endonuclease-like (RecB) superfamily